MVDEVYAIFGIKKKELFCFARFKRFSYAKKMFINNLRKKGLSSTQIGNMMKLDHSTVLYHLRDGEMEKVRKYLEWDNKQQIKRLNYKTGEVICVEK